MLTPQEVSEHAFAKSAFGGYNMTMVDEFLDDPGAISLVEWPERIAGLLPADAVRVELKHLSAEEREIRVVMP